MKTKEIIKKGMLDLGISTYNTLCKGSVMFTEGFMAPFFIASEIDSSNNFLYKRFGLMPNINHPWDFFNEDYYSGFSKNKPFDSSYFPSELLPLALGLSVNFLTCEFQYKQFGWKGLLPLAFTNVLSLGHEVGFNRKVKKFKKIEEKLKRFEGNV